MGRDSAAPDARGRNSVRFLTGQLGRVASLLQTPRIMDAIRRRVPPIYISRKGKMNSRITIGLLLALFSFLAGTGQAQASSGPGRFLAGAYAEPIFPSTSPSIEVGTLLSTAVHDANGTPRDGERPIRRFVSFVMTGAATGLAIGSTIDLLRDDIGRSVLPEAIGAGVGIGIVAGIVAQRRE